MPIYPTDENFVSPKTATDTATSVNNVTNHRESKIQVAEATRVNSGDVFTCKRANSEGTLVAAAHGFVTGTPLYFTYLSNITYGVTARATPYYAIYTTANTFQVADTSVLALAGTAINITGDITEAHYYTPDGIIAYGELSGVTDTIADLADVSLDTMPASATATVDGKSALAQLVSEITLLYDELLPTRTGNLTASTSASGLSNVFTTTTAHGMKTGVPIAFTSVGSGLGNTGLTASNETLYTATVVSATTFTVTVVATGLTYSVLGLGATVTWYNPLTAGEKKYLANLKSLKFNYLQDEAIKLAFELKRFTAEVQNINKTGIPAVSRYPSGEVV